MSTRLGTSSTPRTFAVIAAAAFASAGVGSASFQAGSPGAVSATRLGLTGTPIVDATTSLESGVLVSQGGATVAFAGGTAESLSELSVSGLAEVAFAGSSTAESSLASIGRSIPALVSGQTIESILTSTLSVTVNFRSGTAATQLSIAGIPGKWRFVQPKEIVETRSWEINETLGIDFDIEDFDERVFSLVDTLGLSFDPTAFYGASSFVASGTATASFASASTRASALSAAGAATSSLAGAGVSVNSGDWALTGEAAVSFQGTVVGTVFGTGALSVPGSASVAFVGRSFHESAIEIAGASTVSLAPSATHSAELSSAGVAVVDFSNSTNAEFSADGVGAAAFGGESTFSGDLSAEGIGALAFVGHRLGGTPVFTLEVVAEDLEIVPANDVTFEVRFEPTEIAV